MSERQILIPRFQVLRRGELIRTVPLSRSRLVVGSEEGAQLRLKHPAIAPRHLEVQVVNGCWLEAANLAGEGRVLLDSQPMNRARLREGDELDLGPVTLKLTFERGRDPHAGETVLGGDGEGAAPAAGAHAAGSGEGARAGAAARGGTGQAVDDEEEGTVLDRSPARAAAEAEEDTDADRPHAEEETTDPGLAAVSPPARALTPAPAVGGSALDVELDDIVLDPTPIAVIEPPGGRAQRVPLRVGSFVVGAGRCAFRLSYPGVAPAHAEMMVMPDGLVYIKHLAGSGLLTLRNGAPVQFSRWVTGDRLQVGPVSLRLETVPRAEAVSGTPTRVGRGGPPGRPAPLALPGSVGEAQPARGPGRPEPLGPRMEPAAAEAPAAPALAARAAASPAATGAAAAPAAGARTASASARGPAQASPAPAAHRAAAALPSLPPLVKVRGKRPLWPARKKARVSAPAASNSVEVHLDVSSRDTFAAIEMDAWAESAPAPRPTRWLMPLMILLLLGVVGVQAGSGLLFSDESTGRVERPKTARGASGLPDEEAQASALRLGDGPVRIGGPSSARRGAADGGGAGERRWSGPQDGSIDWEDRSRMYIEGARGSSGGSVYNASINARPADDVQREDDGAAPGSGGSGSAQGWVEMGDVEKVLYDNGKKLRYCYTQARQTDETLEGILWLTMTLGSDGRIGDVVAEDRSTLRSDDLLSCFRRQLRSLPMPAPRGGPVTFSNKWEFRPSGD